MLLLARDGEEKKERQELNESAKCVSGYRPKEAMSAGEGVVQSTRPVQ